MPVSVDPEWAQKHCLSLTSLETFSYLFGSLDFMLKVKVMSIL